MFRMSKRNFSLLILGMIVLILGLAVLYLMLGDKDYPLSQIFSNAVVLHLRVPRLLALIFAGILLSTSGFLVQAMTNNPIAEMSTLGISGGASLALSLLLTLGFSTSDLTSGIFATVGAFLALLVVIILASRSRFQPMKLLLVGTSIGLFTTALASSLTFYTHNAQAYFLWIVGSFSGITSSKVGLLAGASLLALTLTLLFSRGISALSLGEEMATGLGVSVLTVRLVCMLVVAIASGVTVASVGVISFVGLIAPQLAGRFRGLAFGQGLLLTNLFGILIVLIADFLARNLIRPYEFPAGSLTLLVGAGFFIALISSEKGARQA